MNRITLTDPVLIKQMLRAGAGVLRDPEGRLLGSFEVVAPNEPPGGEGPSVQPPADEVVQSVKPPETNP